MAGAFDEENPPNGRGHRLSVEGRESETANSNWIYDARFTPGSKGEFLDVGGPGGIRMWNPRDPTDKRLVEDPVKTLQDGVPVLFLHNNLERRVFKRSVLKLDDKLEFLFVISIVRSKNEDPVAIQISDITEVLSAQSAVAVCDSRSIKDPYLSSETAVVIQGSEERIFMASPQQLLASSIEAVREARNAVGSPGHSRSASRAHLGNRKHYLDGIRLINNEAIYVIEVLEFVFELVFKHVEKAIEHKVAVTLEAKDCLNEVAKIRKKTLGRNEEKHESWELQPVDAARIDLALRDAISLRRWATSTPTPLDMRRRRNISDGELPGDTLLAFVLQNDATEMRATDDTQEVVDANLSDDVALLEESCADEEANLYYEATSRATLRAMTHLFELEHEYMKTVTSAAKLTILSDDVEGLPFSNRVEPQPQQQQPDYLASHGRSEIQHPHPMASMATSLQNSLGSYSDALSEDTEDPDTQATDNSWMASGPKPKRLIARGSPRAPSGGGEGDRNEIPCGTRNCNQQ